MDKTNVVKLIKAVEQGKLVEDDYCDEPWRTHPVAVALRAAGLSDGSQGYWDAIVDPSLPQDKLSSLEERRIGVLISWRRGEPVFQVLRQDTYDSPITKLVEQVTGRKVELHVENEKSAKKMRRKNKLQEAAGPTRSSGSASARKAGRAGRYTSTGGASGPVSHATRSSRGASLSSSDPARPSRRFSFCVSLAPLEARISAGNLAHRRPRMRILSLLATVLRRLSSGISHAWDTWAVPAWNSWPVRASRWCGRTALKGTALVAAAPVVVAKEIALAPFKAIGAGMAMSNLPGQAGRTAAAVDNAEQRQDVLESDLARQVAQRQRDLAAGERTQPVALTDARTVAVLNAKRIAAGREVDYRTLGEIDPAVGYWIANLTRAEASIVSKLTRFGFEGHISGKRPHPELTRVACGSQRERLVAEIEEGRRRAHRMLDADTDQPAAGYRPAMAI